MRSQQQQQQSVQIPLVKQQPLGAALVTPGGQTLQQQPSLAAKQLTYSTVTQPAAQFGGSPTTVVTTNNAAVGMRQQVATPGAYIQQQQPTNNTLQTFQPQTSTLTFQQQPQQPQQPSNSYFTYFTTTTTTSAVSGLSSSGQMVQQS